MVIFMQPSCAALRRRLLPMSEQNSEATSFEKLFNRRIFEKVSL